MAVALESKQETVKQLDIWFADLGEQPGSIQRGLRPVVVISNDKSNQYSNFVMVSPISSQVQKAKLPTHVVLKSGECGVAKDSVAMFEQHISITKEQLKYKLFELPLKYERDVERAIEASTSRRFSRR